MMYKLKTKLMINNIIALVFTILFWIVLFTITPYSSIKEQYDNKYEISLDMENKDSIENKKNIEKFLKQNSEMQTLDKFGIAIFIYVLIIYILLMAPDEKLRYKKNYFFSLGISIIVVLFTTIYYYNIKKYCIKDFEYNQAFWLVNFLPTVLVSYQIVRSFYKLILNDEPRIVGKIELFTDIKNWLFTILFIEIGFYLGYLIDLIKKIEMIIKYCA